MTISEVFIISNHSTVLAAKSYRLNTENGNKDIFIQKVRESSGQLAPHFKHEDIFFYYIRRNGLYFVATAKHEQSPLFVVEILSRIYQTCKDFCGVVNEESVRVNSLLVFEILEEILDYGYMQLATTEKLRPYIQTDPVITKSTREPTSDISSRVFGIETRVTSSSASNKPFIQSSEKEGSKNEIFVDVLERLTAVVNVNGTVSRIEANGSINMKNFLSGTPEVKIGLNEDLVISEGEATKAYGDQVQLDKCNFHHQVRLTEFRDSRVLMIQPPIGELAVMTYSVSGEVALNLPFRLLPFVSRTESGRDILLSLRLKNETASNINAVNVCVQIPVPPNTTSVSQHLRTPEQTAEFKSKEKKIVWKIKTFPGQTETVAQFRLINQSSGNLNSKDIGPLSLDFEISRYTSSGLQVRFLKIQGPDKANHPHRWVRSITLSDSYVVKTS